MNIDTSVVIKDMDGKPMLEPVRNDDGTQAMDGDVPKTRHATFKTVACGALNFQMPVDPSKANQEQNWEAKIKRGALMLKLYEAVNLVELDTTEAALIKEVAGKCPMISPWVMHQLHSIIEAGKAAKVKPSKGADAGEAPAKAKAAAE